MFLIDIRRTVLSANPNTESSGIFYLNIMVADF